MARIIAWALAALLLGNFAWAATPVPANADEELALIQQGLKNYDAKDYPLAAEQLKTAVEAPAYDLVTDKAKYLAQRVLADAAYNVKDYATSLTAARRATQFDQADGNDWYERVWAALKAKDKTETITSLTVLASRWPKQLADFDFDFIRYVYNSVEGLENAEQLKTDLAHALLDAGWVPADKPAADWIWFNLARHDLLAGDAGHAAKAAQRITSSYWIRAMRIEKIFDPIVNASPALFDSEKAQQREIEDSLKKVKDKPDLLEAVVEAASDLAEIDRPDEALALCDQALAKIEHQGTGAFKDTDDQLNWLYDTRSRALHLLGHPDQAVAALEAGAKRNEQGGSNVSQVINLAEVYVFADRPADALALLGKLDKNVSAYGKMQAEYVRGCAFAALKDANGLKQSLSYIDSHVDDDIGAVIRTHLCADDVEGAARQVIAQLAKPDKRGSAITQLQIYLQPKHAVFSEMERKLHAGYEALRARDDVKKTLDPYGRIIKMNVLDTY